MPRPPPHPLLLYLPTAASASSTWQPPSWSRRRAGIHYCRECWRGYLTSKVTDGHVLQLSCPFPQCARSLSSAEVLALLPRALHRKYDRFRQNAEIALDPDARWCPTVNCESVMIGSREEPKLRCGKCRRSLCFNCNEAWHEGRSCEEAASSVMQQYKASHDVKACPQCNTTIERSEGCNQYTAARTLRSSTTHCSRITVNCASADLSSSVASAACLSLSMTCTRCRFQFCCQSLCHPA